MIRGLLVLFVISLLASGGSAGQKLGVYPSTLEFKLDKGQTLTQTVHLFNGTDKSLGFRLYLNDWLRDSTGAHAYYPADTLPQSCSRWLSLEKTEMIVGPGKTADIDVTLRIPDSSDAADEMKWSMLFLEQIDDVWDHGTGVSGAEVRGLLRWGVHIYQTPPAADIGKIRVHEISYEAGDAAIRLVCENVGKAMVLSSFCIELTQATGRRKQKLASREYPLFPGQRRHISYPLPKGVRKGRHSARIVVKPGKDLTVDAAATTIQITK